MKVWNTWGPVENVALTVFKTWSTSDISNFANWGNYVLFPFFIPCMMAIDKNLRASMLLGSFLMMFGAGIRCLLLVEPDLSETVFTVLCHVCACLNGVSGILFCSAPPVISATWFPPEERVTATSIGQMFNGLGNGVSFLLARLFVWSSGHGTSNGINCQGQDDDDGVNNTHSADKALLRGEINNYLLSLAIPPVVFFLCILLYFPSKPPTPPSVSAMCQDDRPSLLAATRSLLRTPAAWLLVTVTAVSQSVPGTWAAMMVTNMSRLQVGGQCLSEQWIDVLAMVSSTVCTCMAILAARLTDTLRGHMKVSIMTLLILATATFTALSLVSLKVHHINVLPLLPPHMKYFRSFR